MRTTKPDTRGAIDPAWRRWDDVGTTLRKTIADIRGKPSPHGQKWIDNTAAYYERKLVEHAKVEPKKHLD